MPPDPSALLSQRQAALASAVDELYRAFKRYPLPEDLDRLGFSDYPAEDKALLGVPLAHLTTVALEHVADHGISTWGSVDDFKHFLPRILDLLGAGPFVLPEVVFGKFRYAGWRHWPHREQHAVERYLLAYWQCVLAEYPSRLQNAGDALCSVAGALDDVTPLLHEWMFDTARPALHHLAEFVKEAAPCHFAWKELPNAFWDMNCLPQMQQVGAWLESLELLRRVEKLFFLHCKDDLAQPLSDALTQLEALHPPA
jgi:hypothetical protein